MRAVIFSTSEWPELAPLTERYPAPLLPLVDRPFLQHVIEFLVSQGVKQFDLVLCHLPKKIEDFLGDGQRWGCTFTYYLARDPLKPYRLLRTLDWQHETGPILVGHGDRLPCLALKDTAAQAALFTCRRAPAEEPTWTGWALLSAEQLGRLPVDVDEAGLQGHLDQLPADELHRVEVPHALSFQTFNDLLLAHRTVLAKEFPGLLLTGNEADPGIWLSRNVVLHPTALLYPPVYICDNCEIGDGVKLGPGAVVGTGCVLDTRSTVTNAVIFPGSYIGEELELSDVLVDKNHLINARMGTAVKVTDNFILGNLEEQHLRAVLARLGSQLLGALLLLLALPVLLITALVLKLTRGGPVLHRRAVVRLPARKDAPHWPTFRLWSFLAHGPSVAMSAGPAPATLRGFLLGFLPALVNVARGDLAFVGVPPRSPEAIRHLPHDWQELYLAGKAGLVTEAVVVCGPDPTEDQLFAAETVSIAAAGRKTEVRLLVGYLYRAFFGFGAQVVDKTASETPAPAK